MRYAQDCMTFCRVAKALGTAAALGLLCVGVATEARSGETGHYFPGVLNVRDYVVPPEGFYYMQYNGYYHSDTFRNASGDKIDSVSVGPATIDVDVNVDVWMFVPTVIWSTGWKVLGADYAVYIAPSFGNASVGAEASLLGRGVDAEESSFGIGDLLVQPLWLGWHWTHFDLSAGYGFYAPVGKYDEGNADNIGLGYWSHDLSMNGVYYPFANKATAFSITGMYEINTERDGTDITPGDHFGLEWGISQYLSERLELGISGYSLWQVTDDSGSDARSDAHDRVHGIGGQVAYWFVPETFYVSGRYVKQYGARDRFEGDYGVLSFLIVF